MKQCLIISYSRGVNGAVSADDLGKAEAAVGILEQIGEISQLDSLKGALKLLRGAAPAMAFIGPILAFAGAFLPDENHEAVMKQFANLDRKIGAVREDIENLNRVVKWESTKLQVRAHKLLKS